MSTKSAMPSYIRYEKPPVSFDGACVGTAELDDFRVRVRVYDYGVVSLALTRAFSGSWQDLLTVGQALEENADLEQRAEHVCRAVVQRLGPRSRFWSLPTPNCWNFGTTMSAWRTTGADDCLDPDFEAALGVPRDHGLNA